MHCQRVELVPTLLLRGESDRVVGTDYARAYAAAIPGAQLRLIPRAGHYPYLERPAEFMDAVETVLGAQPAGYA